MTGDQIGNLSYLVLMIVLVASAFAAQRVPLRDSAKMLLGWVAVFGVGFVLLSFRHDVRDLVATRIGGKTIVSGGSVRIPMEEDGHFYVDARINDAKIRLMVDSGATTTTLSPASAKEAGVESSSTDFPAVVSTANGNLKVDRARVGRISVGNIVMEDLAVHITPRDDVDLLGMNFLSRLSSWRVEGRTLVLDP